MQAVSEGGASRVAVQLVGGAGAGDRRRDAAGAREMNPAERRGDGRTATVGEG